MMGAVAYLFLARMARRSFLGRWHFIRNPHQVEVSHKMYVPTKTIPGRGHGQKKALRQEHVWGTSISGSQWDGTK